MNKQLAVLATLSAVALGAVAFCASASAAVETKERLTDITFISTCTGELVAVTSETHILSRVQVDGNGVSHLGSTITTFFTGETASGLRLVSPNHQTTQIRGDLAAQQNHTETFEGNIVLQGESTGMDDLHAHAIFHFTFNANAELTASKFNFESVCT